MGVVISASNMRWLETKRVVHSPASGRLGDNISVETVELIHILQYVSEDSVWRDVPTVTAEDIAAEESKVASNFATTNLQQFHETSEGSCAGCGKKKAVCEHSKCATCLCEHYCWLD